jgi:hypothetical protein
MRRPAAALALGATALAVAAGCGSSHHPPTKDQYVARANAVCADASRTIKALTRNPLPLRVLAPKVLAVRQAANVRLRAIPLPADSSGPTEWLHLREAALNDAKKIFQEKPQSPAYKAANSRYREAEQRVSEVAVRLGVRQCLGTVSN